jgi:hypothetical protein
MVFKSRRIGRVKVDGQSGEEKIVRRVGITSLAKIGARKVGPPGFIWSVADIWNHPLKRIYPAPNFQQ